MIFKKGAHMLLQTRPGGGAQTLQSYESTSSEVFVFIQSCTCCLDEYVVVAHVRQTALLQKPGNWLHSLLLFQRDRFWVYKRFKSSNLCHITKYKTLIHEEVILFTGEEHNEEHKTTKRNWLRSVLNQSNDFTWRHRI